MQIVRDLDLLLEQKLAQAERMERTTDEKVAEPAVEEAKEPAVRAGAATGAAGASAARSRRVAPRSGASTAAGASSAARSNRVPASNSSASTASAPVSDPKLTAVVNSPSAAVSPSSAVGESAREDEEPELDIDAAAAAHLALAAEERNRLDEIDRKLQALRQRVEQGERDLVDFVLSWMRIAASSPHKARSPVARPPTARPVTAAAAAATAAIEGGDDIDALDTTDSSSYADQELTRQLDAIDQRLTGPQGAAQV